MPGGKKAPVCAMMLTVSYLMYLVKMRFIAYGNSFSVLPSATYSTSDEDDNVINPSNIPL